MSPKQTGEQGVLVTYYCLRQVMMSVYLSKHQFSYVTGCIGSLAQYQIYHCSQQVNDYSDRVVLTILITGLREETYEVNPNSISGG